MDESTVQRLNDINKNFHRVTANDFDLLRRGAWPGWKRLLPYLKSPLSVLDVGCGNGRFGLFLAKNVDPHLHYHGTDNNAPLLERARLTLQDINAHLELRDLVDDLPDFGQFDLVALFGVLHHVPGSQH